MYTIILYTVIKLYTCILIFEIHLSIDLIFYKSIIVMLFVTILLLKLTFGGYDMSCTKNIV